MAIYEANREWSPEQLGYVRHFLLHSEKDVKDLPECCVGSRATVAETDNEYICTVDGWKLQSECEAMLPGGVDAEARKQISALTEEIEALKGGEGSGATGYEVIAEIVSSSGEFQASSPGKGLRTSLIAKDDVESAKFIAPTPSDGNLYAVLYDENENFIKRITRSFTTTEVRNIIPDDNTTEYSYFLVSYYNNAGITEENFRAMMDIKFKGASGVDYGVFVKNDMSTNKCVMPKWSGIHPWVEFEGVTSDQVTGVSFETWYSRFHALTETYSGVGLEEVNMSTNYLAANTDDAVPAAISSLTNGGMYMWHLPAPSGDESGQTIKHKTPKIVISSGVHGDEPSAVWCVWKMLDALCRNDAEHRAITLLRNFCDIYVIPLANPYGIENSTCENENSINLARDFDIANWAGDSNDSSVPAAPNSQYGTRCISWWLDQIKPDGLIDLHASYGSNTFESGRFVQWGLSPVPAIESLIEENIMDVTPYIRKNLAPSFDDFNHWFGHTANYAPYSTKGMIANYAHHNGILAATYEVVRCVKWDEVFILSTTDKQPEVCAMNYHGIVNFVIKFVQMVVETLNSGVDWQSQTN